MNNWKDKDYWRKVCPRLRIFNDYDDDAREAASITIEKDADETTKLYFQTLKKRIHQQGFATIDTPMTGTTEAGIVVTDPNSSSKNDTERFDTNSSLHTQPSLLHLLRDGIEALHEAELPATFIFLFDAAWELAARSRHALEQCTLETNQFNFDVLAWRIDDQVGGGFSPHRDRQPKDAAASFSYDGHAKYVTQWVALTPATTETSCLYVIPKTADPGYFDGDDNEEDLDPLQRALPNKQAFQHIMAIPRQPGQSVLFTHRLIHWGSARNLPVSKVMPPRIAMSFVCSDPSFEKPYVDLDKHFSTRRTTTTKRVDPITPSADGTGMLNTVNDSVAELTVSHITSYKLPPFYIRLLIVCSQMLIYHDRFPWLNRRFLKACYDYCKEYKDELEESYRQKVFYEFVKAMKDPVETDSTAVETRMTMMKRWKNLIYFPSNGH